MKLYIFFTLFFTVGMIAGYVSADKIYFNKFLNLLDSVRLGIINRIDRAIIGNDQCYSSTRINTLVWGIGGFSLTCLAVMRHIQIPGPVLALMGGAMGITGIQNVINKSSELKSIIAQAAITNKPVVDEVENDKSN